MKTENGFIQMTVAEFAEWLNKQKVTRKIKLIQIHHTGSPTYKEWNRTPNGLYWQKSMKNYHVNSAGYSDIAQQFTICPDGTIITGRSLNSNPAGIKGANTGAICIENFGNFDKGGDVMNATQANAIVAVVALLLQRFNLTTNNITYHCWWTANGSSLGDYKAGKSCKTCPGTNFFGGNTKAMFNSNFKVKVQNYNTNESEEIDVEELKALQNKITELEKRVNELENPMVYNYIDSNMPEFAKATIQKLVNKGILKGDSNGLNLTYEMLRILTVLDRQGVFDR